MIVPRIRVIGDKILSLRFRRKAVTLPAEIEVELERNAQRCLLAVQRRASGRPGPQVITGEYRSSWRIDRPGRNSRVVTTDAEQAPRLELGFTGIDVLGRQYHQPPFPHMRPAADEVESAFVRDMSVVVTRGL